MSELDDQSVISVDRFPSSSASSSSSPVLTDSFTLNVIRPLDWPVVNKEFLPNHSISTRLNNLFFSSVIPVITPVPNFFTNSELRQTTSTTVERYLKLNNHHPLSSAQETYFEYSEQHSDTSQEWGSQFNNSSSISPSSEIDAVVPHFNGMLILAGVTFYLLALSTAVGNALVLHAIRTEKRLQTVSNMFIMSLAAADLTVGLIVMPISAAYFVAGEWRWGVIICQVWLAVDYTASTASIFNLVVLSLDRYWSVSNPLRYLHKRTRKRAMMLIGGSWAAAALWIIPLLSWHHVFYEGNRQHPPHVCETEFSDNITFKIITSVLNFYGPCALMALLYCRIFRTIKTRSSDALGRVTPLESSNNHNHSTATSVHHRQTYRNLTIVAYPDAEEDPSTSFYKGIIVQVDHVDEPSSSLVSKHSKKKKKYIEINTNKSYKSRYLNPRRPLTESRSNSSCLSYQKNHENHIACYPGSHQTVWTSDLPSEASTSDNDRWASFRSCRGGFAGLRGLLSERRGESSSDRNASVVNHTSNGRKNGGTSTSGGPLNIAKEKKAARQLGVIMGAFFACWIPYFTLFPIIAFCNDCIPARIHLAAIWLGYLNSTLNPMIYPLCNQHFRRAFARMLRCRRADR